MVAALSTADWPSSGTVMVKMPPTEEQGRDEPEEAAMALPAAVAATWRVDVGWVVMFSMEF